MNPRTIPRPVIFEDVRVLRPFGPRLPPSPEGSPVSILVVPPTEDIQHLPSNRIWAELPEEGVLLPTRIVIPAVTAPKGAILNLMTSLGMVAPSSYTRAVLLERLQNNLTRLRYTIQDGVATRTRPVRISLERSRTQIESPSLESVLPEVILSSVFDTKHSIVEFIREHDLGQHIRTGTGRLKNDILNDLRSFLMERGYVADQRGNLVHQGGVTIPGGYEFSQLIPTKEYVDFLRSPIKIRATSADLQKINLPLTSAITNLSRRRWQSLADFSSDLAASLGISVELATLLSLLSRLERESNKELMTILQEIGDVTQYRRVEDRLAAVKGYFRAKLELVPTTYSRRESFRGVAPTTMTMEQAIQEGYRFEPEQYPDEINEFLDFERIPSSQRRELVTLFQTYPEMFKVMQQYRPWKMTLSSLLIGSYYPQTPTLLQQFYSYAVNYPLEILESEEKKRRREQISQLPQNYLQTLYGIYQNTNLEEILDLPQHPLELYLTAIHQSPIEALPGIVLGVGMLIPEHLLKREIRGYVLRWLPSYRDVITRPTDIPPLYEAIREPVDSLRDLIDQLSRYSDPEIVTFFGYTGGYENRNAMIDNIFETMLESQFILYNEIDPNRAINVETIMLTPVGELPRPYLVFGGPFRYRVLELDDLVQAWSGGDFTRVEGEGEYNASELSNLQGILPHIKRANPALSETVDYLMERVKSGLFRMMRRNDVIDTFIRLLRGSTLQDAYKDLFYKIFYAGMYMRRWKGPGNQYPNREAGTRAEINPEPKVVLLLGEISSLMNQLQETSPEVWAAFVELPLVDYTTRADDIVIRWYGGLLSTIADISQGRQCIRAGSRGLVLAGHYYLAVVFEEAIPDFSPYQVDQIN